MLNTAPLIQGTWSEVLSHKDEIPETSEVEVRILSRQVNGEEEARLQKVIDHFLQELGQIAEKEHRPLDEIGEELIRQARFPEIEFRDIDILGERAACVKGRLEVWQVMMVARHCKEDTTVKVAQYFDMPQEKVQCALDYYAAYPDEIDAALAENDSMTYEEMKRRYPEQKIELWELTDEALERLDREYPGLKDLTL